jgi:PAS domain S-box-containing protein
MSESTNNNAPPAPEGKQRFRGLRLSQKITVLIVLVALISGSVVAVADYRLAAGELRQSVEEKLLALLEARRAAIIDSLASIRRDLRMQSGNPFVLDAFQEFAAGWRDLGDDAAEKLCNAYVVENPYPPAARKQLGSPGDGSPYSLAHERYHPLLREFVEQHGYRDLLLIDTKGRVIYSAMKQQDFAINLFVEADVGGGLGLAFHGIIDNPSPTAEVFVDFNTYLATGGRPTGFVAMPLDGEGGERLGVLVFEMPVYRINRVMNVAAGMGETGETFIAGQDLLVRTDSRFATRSTILERRVDSGPVKAALNGESGVMISVETDEVGKKSEKLSAFAPLDFLGARWAIIAQADLRDILAPVTRMRDRAVVNGLLLALLVAGLGYVVTRYTVVKPLSGIADAVQRLTRGETGRPVPSTGRGDEIGDIARALVLYKESLEEHERLAAEHDEIIRAEAARHRLAEAIEALSDGFILLDPEDRVVLVNSKYKEIYHQSAHLLTPGADFGAFLRHHVDIGEIVEAQGRVEEFLDFRMNRMQPGEVIESRLASGRWLKITDFEMEDKGIVSVCSDITDLKRREQALVESEERYRLLVDTLPDGVLLHDSRRILFLNPIGRKILGIGEDEQVEKYHYRDFVHEDQRAKAEARIAAIIQRGDDNPLTERRIHTKDGRDIYIEIAAVPLRRGRETLALGVFRDLTDSKQAQAEIERQREALYQSEKLSALGSLLAGVAHELNNPLSIVVAQAVLMEETNRDEKIIKRAQSIRSAAERCARIVKTFLSMARQQTPEQGSVDVNVLVGNALELMGYTLRTAGVEIIEKRGEELPLVWGDADQLHQVVANLLVNAQQAMMDTPEPRRLTISTAFDAAVDMVTLTLDDTGPGVPPDLRARIFDPFFTTKPTGVGTGIGLSVCHGVVESHGGNISVTDSPDGGARFLIQLPPAGAAVALSVEPEAPVAAEVMGRRILVVDDEPEIAESLAEILGLDGHSVDLADSGTTALERIAETDYDLILTDMRMPKMDGPTLYREIEKNYPHLCSRIAVVTGDTLEAAASDFLKETELRWIEKPFVPDDICKVVEEMLGGG